MTIVASTVNYEAFLDLTARRLAGTGHELDTTHLDECDPFKRYYRTGTRVRVTRTYDNGDTRTRTGLVGVTTGRRPVFLLLARSSAHGSSDVIDGRDRIVAIKPAGDRTYRPVSDVRPGDAVVSSS